MEISRATTDVSTVHRLPRVSARLSLPAVRRRLAGAAAGRRLPIGVKLVLSYLLIIIIAVIVFIVVGKQLVGSVRLEQ